MFITTTAEPLSAFLMTISELSLRAFRPILSCLVKLLHLLCLGLLFSISCFTDLWNISRALLGGLGPQLDLGLNFLVVPYFYSPMGFDSSVTSAV